MHRYSFDSDIDFEPFEESFEEPSPPTAFDEINKQIFRISQKKYSMKPALSLPIAPINCVHCCFNDLNILIKCLEICAKQKSQFSSLLNQKEREKILEMHAAISKLALNEFAEAEHQHSISVHFAR